jgi:putative transposase
VFRDELDRISYIDLLGESCAMYGLEISAYSLMPNHVHHIAVPERSDSIAKTFHRAHGMYANLFNEKHDLVGHLWQERPFSCILSDTHLRNAIRYVENNPVRAGLVKIASDYRWSSARAHCLGEPDLLLNGPETAAIAGWAEWLQGNEEQTIDDLIRKCTVKGRPCGDKAFLRKLEELTGQSLHPKTRGRKRKVGASGEVQLDFDKGAPVTTAE